MLCLTDLHQCTSPIYNVNQWHQLAADKDCDLPLAATSSSAQLSSTLVQLQDPKAGISFQQISPNFTTAVFLLQFLKKIKNLMPENHEMK